jgi:glycosyltransferase involved in cell wall biosynthesis
MRLSVVIPAFNEADYIEACILSIRAALRANSARINAPEIIVTDNNSTDRTADIAWRCGARVVFEPHRQISRARNRGAGGAGGDWLLFVDADCLVFPETIREMLDRIETGRCVGGGCAVRLDRGSRAAHALARTTVSIFRMARWAGGSFLFCRRDAFGDVGGFSEHVYAGEEVFLSMALKRWGQRRRLGFAFLTRQPIITSARKLDTHGMRGFLRTVLRGVLSPGSTLTSRDRLAFFYEARR